MFFIKSKKTIKRVYNGIIIVLFVGAIVYALSHFVHLGNIEYTDDAQVQRHITPVNNRVQGFIREIRFEEYQRVHKGDTLVIIEDAEYRLQLAQAEAGLRGSKSGSDVISAGISTASSNVVAASAGIEEARVNMLNAKDDYDRYAALLEKEAVTQQQYDNMKARYEAAKAIYDRAVAGRKSSTHTVSEQARRLSVSTENESVAEAAVNLARLNLSYTVVLATADGVMGRKDIHEGQLVQPGEQLARIVDNDKVWVIANYRETQLKNIHIGSDVTFTADALPNITFKGKVVSFSPATGSAYSMVATDNATGNFVKVEQRVPIRIELTEDNKAEDVELLLAGLNVETKVKRTKN